MAFALLFRLFYALSLTMLTSVYIYKLSNNSNKVVGYISGAQGLMNLACAIPAGVMADRVSRQALLRTAAVVSVFAGIATFAAILTDSVILVGIFFALWGAAEGLQSAPLSAVFADSIPTGARSFLFSLQYALAEGATFVGPLLTIVLFATQGDEWDMGLLRIAIGFGAILGVIAYGLLWLITDDASLGLESEAVDLDAVDAGDLDEQEEEEEEVEEDHVALEEEEVAPGWVSMDEMGSSKRLHTRDDNDGDEDEILRVVPAQKKVVFFCYTASWVPYVLAISDLTFSLGAGMTIMFLPLYLASLGLSPSQLSGTIMLGSAATVIICALGQRISRLSGRLQVSIVTKGLGILCLYCMAFVDRPVIIVILLYAFRVAFARTGVPLDRSIVMDCVPKEMRGKWNVVESIGAVSFTGSAVVGGVLIDAMGYQSTFSITATVYVFATAIIFPLIPFVPKVEAKLQKVKNAAYQPLQTGDPHADPKANADADLLAADFSDGDSSLSV